ncbi:SDR family oxidoreductase [Actinopolymorpha pittospori]
MDFSGSLSGNTALVTGATAGIGRAVAVQLAGLGAEVVVHGRDPDRGAETAREIEAAGGKARFEAADLSVPDEVRRLAEAVGPVDILINNAGVYRFASTVETDDAFFDLHFDLNLRAPFILVQKLVPGMAARGHGSVVNLSTFGASVPARTAGVYGASKAGLELMTKIWADEFGPSGVRVNAVAAGPTHTPGTAGGVADALTGAITLGRAAEAEEIARVIVFLTTPSASYVNGSVVQVHGGLRAVSG